MQVGDIIRRISRASNIAFGAYYRVTKIKNNGDIIGHCVDSKTNIGIIGRKTDNFKIYSIKSILVSECIFFSNTSPLQSVLKIEYNEKTKVITEKKPDLVKLYTRSNKYITVRQDGIVTYLDYWENKKIKIYYDCLIDQKY